MKVTVNEEKKPMATYPYIGIHEDKDLIVLFSDKNTGCLLKDYSEIMCAGIYSVCWGESEFEPLKGTITLSNE